MTPLRRLAFIGNSLPRRCGIATFTTDLQQAIATSRPDLETCIVAMNDHGRPMTIPPRSALQIEDGNHRRLCARRRLPERRPVRRRLLCSTNSEFSAARPAATSSRCCRGSPCRSSRRCIPCWPNRRRRSATCMDASSTAPRKIVVMAEKGRELLRTRLSCARRQDRGDCRTAFPTCRSSSPMQAKAKLGFNGKSRSFSPSACCRPTRASK